MALPLRYTLRSVAVRRGSAILTALGIAMTVAVFAGIIALRQGFEQVYRPRGREDVVVYLRLGANSEGESGIGRQTVDILVKERPEIARDAQGRPLAAAEMFLAVFLEKTDGGLTNVPLRGIQPRSIELQGEQLRLVEGRWPSFGSDEVVVGRPLTTRIENCQLGDTLTLNITPFEVVGVFEHEGAQGSEIWGDADRMMDALERPFFQRVIARVRPATDVEALADELKNDARTPVQLRTERDYLARQTVALGAALTWLASFLTLIMGIAAVLGAINTMLASVAARTHEIGVLLAIGYPRRSVFLSFLLEAGVIGLAGGLLGVLFVLPLDGMQTGTTNWNTFTDVSFAVQVTPALIGRAFGLSFVLGLIGGALPALRAAALRPIEAMRQL
ncbi:MAG: ABC transporter permease [Acidobacteriota bacterium]|nr:MAG: ABC transporter permease [Acidobacteriota bacterium]